MESAVVRRPVTKKGNANIVLLEQLEGIPGPGRLENARTDNTARPHHAHFGRKEVHTAAAALGNTSGSTEQLGNQRPWMHPLGQGMTVAAMGAKDGIFRAQMGADPHGHRFFTHIGVASAMHQTGGVDTR